MQSLRSFVCSCIVSSNKLKLPLMKLKRVAKVLIDGVSDA